MNFFFFDEINLVDDGRMIRCQNDIFFLINIVKMTYVLTKPLNKEMPSLGF